MFYFLCKTILHGNGRHCLHNYKSSPISIKHISTTTTSNQHSFTVSYLINSCGFSQESALSVPKRFQFDSPEKPDSVIAFFKKHGFTKSQLSKVFKSCPQLLFASPEKTLLPKLEFFYSKGFSSPQLAHTLSLCPSILRRSLENHLIPSFNYLSALLLSGERTIAAITNCPRILFEDLEKCLLHNVNVLQDNGVPEKNIAMFLSSWPRLLIITNSDSFKKKVEVVKEMGFDPLGSQFVYAIVAKGGMTNSEWEGKLNAYKRWGWSEEEALAAFVKHPFCMVASDDKIFAVMDFFVNQMGLESSVIAKRPKLVNLSMEKRFLPRAAVLRFLISKGLIKRKNPISTSFFEYPEKTFLKNFVNSYEEAPELLKLYKEKTNLSKMTKHVHKEKGL